MGNAVGRVTGPLPADDTGLFNTEGTRFDPHYQWKAALVDDLLAQIVRILQKADVTCPVLTQAQRTDGSIDRRALFMALDEQISQRRASALPRHVDGFWPRILKLFGRRYPYILKMKRLDPEKDDEEILLIDEVDLIHASRCWPSLLKRSGRAAKGKESAESHYRRQPRRPRTDVETQSPRESVRWLRTSLQTLGPIVSSQVLNPSQYQGRAIDGPEMILSQARAHFYSVYTHLYDDFTPGPEYTAFNLEEYLDDLILSGRYVDRVSLNDVLEVRSLMVSQQTTRRSKAMQNTADAASIERIINGSTAPRPLARVQRILPFTLELSEKAPRGRPQGSRLPSVSYRLPSPRRPATNRDNHSREAKDVFYNTIRNIEDSENNSQLSSQTGWDPDVENNEEARAFANLLYRQLDQTQGKLRMYTQLAQELRRSMRIKPRTCLRELVKCLDMGLNGDDWRGKEELGFRDDEFTSSGRTQLRPIREAELGWLEFINRPKERIAVSSGPTVLDEILMNRVTAVIDSRDPTLSVVLGDDKRMKLTEFSEGLNSCLSGPVKKTYIDFAQGDGLKKLQSTNLVHISTRRGKDQIQRVQPEYHTEERLVWGEDDTGSANYEDKLPKPENLSIEKDDDGNWHQHQDDQLQTMKFYSCLGYRLGLTIRQLSETFENKETARQNASNTSDLSVHTAEISQGGLLDREVIRELSQVQDVVSENKDRRPPSRGQLWTFGHPTNKPSVRKFFNINRWPLRSTMDVPEKNGGLADIGTGNGSSGSDSSGDAPEVMHTRTPETRRSRLHRAQGMNERRGGGNTGQPGESSMARPEATLREYREVRFGDEKQGKTYHNDRYWGGDTRLQQMHMIDSIRRRLESHPPDRREGSRTWAGALSDALQGKRKREESALGLPTAAFVPMSRNGKLDALAEDKRPKHKRRRRG